MILSKFIGAYFFFFFLQETNQAAKNNDFQRNIFEEHSVANGLKCA